MATSSTRFVNKSLWRDPKSGLVFQVQLQVPEACMKATDDLKILPLKSGHARPIQDDVAAISFGKEPGQVNRQRANRYVTIAANVYGKDLGTASKAVTKAIAGAGEKPKGIIVSVQGQLQLLADTLQGLQTGLVIVIVVIFLMLAAYYHSFALSAIILAVVPAVIAYGGHPRKASTVFARRNRSKVYGCKFSRKNIYSRLSRNSGALDVSSRSVIAEFDMRNLGNELRAG